MGAEQSYQKASKSTDLNIFNDDIDDLQMYLNSKPTTSTQSGFILDSIDIDKYSLNELIEDVSITEANRKTIKETSELLDNIKMSLDMYLLYDNYNVKNKVILKDINKKLINQNSEIKKKHEEIDGLKFENDHIRNKLDKHRSIRKYLLLFILIMVVLILVMIGLLYIKYN